MGRPEGPHQLAWGGRKPLASAGSGGAPSGVGVQEAALFLPFPPRIDLTRTKSSEASTSEGKERRFPLALTSDAELAQDHEQLAHTSSL